MVLGERAPSDLTGSAVFVFFEAGTMRNSNTACVSVPPTGSECKVEVLAAAIISMSVAWAHTASKTCLPLAHPNFKGTTCARKQCPLLLRGPFIEAHQSGSHMRVRPPLPFFQEDPIVLGWFPPNHSPRQGFKQNWLIWDIIPKVESQAGKRKKQIMDALSSQAPYLATES